MIRQGAFLLFIFLLFTVTPLKSQPQNADSITGAAVLDTAALDSTAAVQPVGAPVVFSGDTLFVLYNRGGAFSAQERAAAIAGRIARIAHDPLIKADSLTIQDDGANTDIIFGDTILMTVTEADAQSAGIDRTQLADRYADALLAKLFSESESFSIKTIIPVALYQEIVVTAHRVEESVFDIPTMVTVIRGETAREKSIPQAAEFLREIAGVTVQKTNQGGGSPIIRGMKANRLLFMVDGIRLNNATYRSGNIPYFNTLDAESIDRIEVVHGPHSALYGSDALGGVIHALSRRPEQYSAGLKTGGFFSSQGSTADRTRSVSAGLELSFPRVAGRISGGVKSFGDVRRGAKGGETLMRRLANDSRAARVLDLKQRPNGYKAYDLNGLWRFYLSQRHQLILAYQGNRQLDVPRYDVIETRTDSLNVNELQGRDLVYGVYTFTRPSLLFNHFSVTASWQKQTEHRRRIRAGSRRAVTDRFDVGTVGFQGQFHRIIGTTHHLVYGWDLYYDRVSAESFEKNIDTEQKSDAPTLFPDGSSFVLSGVFAQDTWKPSDAWAVTPGFRWNFSRLTAPFSQGASLPFPIASIRQKSTALTASLGTRYTLFPGLNAVMNIAQGFRTPNLDDASKLGAGKGGAIYEIPNARLGPEKSLSLDAGFKLHTNRIDAEIIGFYNWISDMLVRSPTSINGQSFFVDQGDTLRLFHRTNAGKARTAGLALSTRVSLIFDVSLTTQWNYTDGYNITNREPLSGIPPFNGLVGLNWRRGRFAGEALIRFAGAQNRLSAEDVLDLRIPEGGTPEWHTMNLRFQYHPARGLSLSLALNNLLDRNYREHLSGLNAPGRTILAGIHLKY